jgi:hypothetical protein
MLGLKRRSSAAPCTCNRRLPEFPPAHPFAKTAKGLGTLGDECHILRPERVRHPRCGGSLGSDERRQTRATGRASPRTMLSVDRTPRRSVGGACLAVPLLYGLVPAIVGCVVLRERAAESALLVAFGGLFFIGGALMVSSAAWLLITVGRSSVALWTGGISSILSAALFAGVTLTDVLPCSGPD